VKAFLRKSEKSTDYTDISKIVWKKNRKKRNKIRWDGISVLVHL